MADPGTGDCTSDSCTLRQALAAAANGDRIVFKSNVKGTILLTVGFLSFMTSDVTVDGGGRITIDAQDGGRVLTVGSGRTVNLTGLTLTGGLSSDGAGILNAGTLTVSNSTITQNESTANGGGITNTGTLTLVATTVSANNAQQSGGGIYSSGSLTVQRSTLFGNFAVADGGGIYATAASARIFASTISGNVVGAGGPARGGGIYADGSLLLRSSTVTLNSAEGTGFGGGIFATNDFATVANSIVAGNTAGSAGHDCDEADRFISLGYNLTTEYGGCDAFGAATDLKVAFLSQVFTDVLDRTLQDNGGPTATHALIERGRPVDAGYCPGETADQRGLARPIDEPLRPNVADGCDIGAFEWRPAVTRKK
ncbi:MAG TPA: choice-of-anchor Q domain-containing protein [Gemmatimonadales bacterium]